MAVTRAIKEEELQDLERAFKGTDSAIVVDYKGLKVPEVTELALFLQRMGARIGFKPDRRIVIEGVDHLRGAEARLQGDRLEAFSYLYPLADATMVRKMEGSEITAERLDYVIKAWQTGRMVEHVFCAFLGEPPREDFVPYVADFYLQLEDVQWTIGSGVVNDTFVVSVRNLGYSRNAGDFVRRWFNDIGSAGGHRTMAKAVVPLEAFQRKFGTYEGSRINQRMLELVLEFLHETKEK